MKILLINQYAGNKGDRAVLFAVCRLLLQIYPNCKIKVSTSDPELWDGYDYYIANQIEFVPSGWDYNRIKSHNLVWKILRKVKKYTYTILREGFLRNISFAKLLANPDFYKAARWSDIIISVGGHHFTTILSRDLVSSVNFDSALALQLNKRHLVCFSQSFGPFTFWNIQNLKFTQSILQKSILLPRENQSIVEISTFCRNHPNIIPTYESVLSLSAVFPYRPSTSRDKAIGIAIYCTQQRTIAERESYQNAIAIFCDTAISDGYAIRFFPMEIKGSGPDDRPFISEIISKIKRPKACMIYDTDMETARHLDEVSKCRLFVGHKTHSTIFALATGTPLLAIAYHPKTIEFLKQFDMERFVISDADLDADILITKYRDITEIMDVIGEEEYHKALEFYESIKKSLKDVIEMCINR